MSSIPTSLRLADVAGRVVASIHTELSAGEATVIYVRLTRLVAVSSDEQTVVALAPRIPCMDHPKEVLRVACEVVGSVSIFAR